MCAAPRARPLLVLLFSIGIQLLGIREWSGTFGLSICSRTTTKFVVHTSRLQWALRSLFLSAQNGIEEKCKQIRCVIFARGRRYSADRNSNQFLPKRTRVRKSLCKSSLHGRREGKARYIRECGLSASSQCCLQGASRVSWFWWTGELWVTWVREGRQGHLMVLPYILIENQLSLTKRFFANYQQLSKFDITNFKLIISW